MKKQKALGEKMAFRPTPEMKKELEELSCEQGRTISGMIRFALGEYLKQNRAKTKSSQ